MKFAARRVDKRPHELPERCPLTSKDGSSYNGLSDAPETKLKPLQCPHCNS